jgi:murein tripeptide amidase MpaA
VTFLNVVEIESALVALNSTYPALTQLIALPFPTAEGRRSHALYIRTRTNRCGRAGVLLLGGTHAREWGSPDILVNLATDLLEAYTAGTGIAYGGKTFSAAEVASIVDRVDLIVFPDMNPDGRHHSQTAGAWWRKNRNPASSGGIASRIGVDPNRNYDFLWDFPVAFSPAANPNTLASNDPSSDLFHGTGPFSEAETQNVRWLIEGYPQIRWFVDVHSYGGDILFPWGDDENQSTDPTMRFANPAWNGQRGVDGDAYREYHPSASQATLTAAATVMRDAIAAVRGESYLTAQSFHLPGWSSYPTSGSSDDWVYSRHFIAGGRAPIYAFTYEYNRTQTFFPTWPQMVDIIQDVDAGLLALCLHARPGRLAVILCTIRDWLYKLWRRVWPWELWGPYGPWNRIRQVLGGFVRRAAGVLKRVGPVGRSSRDR